MSKFSITIFVTIILFFIASVTVQIWDSTHVNIVTGHKIIELQQQQLIKEKTTEIRYLVITDKETFICENSLINGKFDNSDLFWHLKKDSTYDFKVAGIGKSFFTDYRNILEVNPELSKNHENHNKD